MIYLLFAILFVIFYILPYGVLSYSLMKFPGNDFVWQSAAESAIGALLVYIVVCLFRSLFYFVSSMLLLRNSEKINKILKYNFLVFFLLFLLDNIVLIIFISTKLYEPVFFDLFEYILIMILFSFSMSYFPFWLVFGVRNLVCYIKNFMTKKG